MTRRILLILTVLMALCGQGQTIHWLTFIDTTDKNVGPIDVFGRNMLYGYFINEVNAALAEKGYKSDIQDFYGYQVTPENCTMAVNMLKAEPEDIIVFYYIGHGGRPATSSDYMRKHPWPQLCLAQNNEDKFVPLEWINEQLKSKGARLSVTLGMCCNSISDAITVKDAPNFTADYAPTYLSSNKRNRIQELFLNTKGNVLATSASPGQTSGCTQIAPDNPFFPNPANYRDRYTYAISLFFMRDLDNYNQTLDWDKFLKEISNRVHRNSNGQQTPIHKVNIAKTPAPAIEKPKAPTSQDINATKTKQTQIPAQKSVSQNTQQPSQTKASIEVVMNENSWKNDLTNYLTTLINTSLSHKERANLEQQLSSTLFATDAKIRFLGQDSETVIDRADAGDWLGILATNPDGRILKVIVEEGKLDSDKKIKELKVREVYKQ